MDIEQQGIKEDNEINEHNNGLVTDSLAVEGAGPIRQLSRTEQAKACLCSITCLALFTTLCFNLVLGIPAIVLAVLAHSTSERQWAHMYSRISLVLSILGIISGVIFITIIVVYVTKYRS